MKRYQYQPYPDNATSEERDEFYTAEALKNLQFVEEHLDEVRAIFKVQLDKPGHQDRALATEEVIKYWFLNDKEKRERGNMEFMTWSSLYASQLITTASIIEAVNNNDRKTLLEEMERLPWGDSNSGDQAAFNATQFVFWILSDEDRAKYADVFEEFLKKSNFCYNNPDKAITLLQNFAELKNLPHLVAHNKETLAEIKAKQPGDGQN